MKSNSVSLFPMKNNESSIKTCQRVYFKQFGGHEHEHTGDGSVRVAICCSSESIKFIGEKNKCYSCGNIQKL